MDSWNKIIAEQTALYSDSIAENRDLQARIRELEQKIRVLNKDLDRADEKNLRLGDDLHDLENDLRAIREDSPTVLCVIDGDGCIPSAQFLRQAREGGQKAAAKLNQSINSDMGRRIQLHTVMYVNRKGLGDALAASNTCTIRDFEEFIIGWNQASPLFSIVDVGYGKEAADVKLRELLLMFARFPQTRRIYFGGGHDNGYATLLRSLETDGLLRKVTLLKSYTRLAADIASLRLPCLTVDGLFREQRLNSHPPRSTVALKSENGWDHIRKHNTLAARMVRSISPSEVSLPRSDDTVESYSSKESLSKIHSLVPTPCPSFYLLGNGCPNGKRCLDAHDYHFTPRQIDQFSEEISNTPCPNRDRSCDFYPACIFNHEHPSSNKPNKWKKDGFVPA